MLISCFKGLIYINGILCLITLTLSFLGFSIVPHADWVLQVGIEYDVSVQIYTHDNHKIFITDVRINLISTCISLNQGMVFFTCSDWLLKIGIVIVSAVHFPAFFWISCQFFLIFQKKGTIWCWLSTGLIYYN